MPRAKPAHPASGPDANTPVSGDPVDCQVYVWQWDPPHTTDRQQFVNLPKAWDPACNGREIEMVGHVEPRAAGKTVTFEVVANPGNEPDSPTATLSAASATTDGQGVAKVKLTLPVYGGSRFKVTGKTDCQPEKAPSGEIQVWRKVYYQVTDMASPPPPSTLSLVHPADMISALQAAFDPVFFKIEPSTKSSDTTPYQAHLTAAQRTSLENSLRTTARDDRSPYKMNIVMCDSADIVAEQNFGGAVNTASFNTPYFALWPYEPTVIHAEYQRPNGSWAPLTNVTTPAHPTDASQVRVEGTIPGFTPPGPVTVRVRVRTLRGRAGGWGGTTGTLFMCLGFDRRQNPATPTGAQLQQALTHEIGHALGLVPNGAAWRDPDPRDAPYSLKHCKYNNTATPPEPRCVMWFMLGGSGPRLRFCNSDRPDDCSHFLYRTDYASLAWI
ncbi:MAG: hypothetical protein JNM26_18925 [Ideonella sp.]|nr:hypothetical protein [Ideonella sp.]